MSTIDTATLRLFKAVLVEGSAYAVDTEQIDALNRITIPKGYLISPAAAQYFSQKVRLGDGDAVREIEKLYGLDTDQLNNSFHKSFAKVRDASFRQLVTEQVIHYMTTYGAQLGAWYNDGSIYVPAERLDAPGIDVDGFRFVVIRGLVRDEIRAELLALLRSGAALSEQSVSDATLIGAHLGLTADEILSVKNNEVRARLYDEMGLVPGDPVEFLRYVTYRLTGTSMLIKNEASRAALAAGAKNQATALSLLFERYDRDHGLSRLGEVFNRYKPLLLALRATPEMRPVINKVRRSAKTNHKPMKADYLNEVTARIKDGSLSIRELDAAMRDANTFRKARLARALAVRACPDLDSIVYKVRNGKSFATDFSASAQKHSQQYAVVRDIVLMWIAESLAPKLSNKRIYIPEGVNYGLPSTEKQFVGNLPDGSYIEAPEGSGLYAGVHWVNQDRLMVDLDLSVMSATAKVGWDGYYRNDDRSVLFSGDMTSAPAPKGASEVFWFGPNNTDSWLMNLNYYNYGRGDESPFKIIVGVNKDGSGIDRSHVIDPNEVLAHAAMSIDTRQMIIGLVSGSADTGRNRFYFSTSANGGGISARNGAQANRVRDFMVASAKTVPSLNDVLRMAEVHFVNSPGEADPGFDLSPSAMDKATILSLLS